MILAADLPAPAPPEGADGPGTSLPLPRSLSPSKVSSFTDCALAFRFSAIDRIPEPPTVATTRGTLVHRALQLLFAEPPAGRTPAAALAALEVAHGDLAHDAEYQALGLDSAEAATFRAEAEALVERYFHLEDPRSVHPVGLEVMLEAEIDGLLLRGIIDRLDWVGPGRLVVTDYKTGKAPPPGFERGKLAGVHFYALLCQRVLGIRPERVQLLYLGGAEPEAVIAEPTERSVDGVARKAAAIWHTIERAHRTDAFRPRRSRLCDWCSFQQFCPEFGGDPAGARQVALARLAAEPVEPLA